MKQYIGIKIIKAVPAIKKGGKVYGEGSPIPKTMEKSEEGYKVIYEDGYESWSPKDVFEKAYRQTDGLNFGLALEAAKQGKGIRLPQWGADVVIRAQYPDNYSKMTAPYLYVESRYGCVPWRETMIELFSDDWQIVD